jgi:hypothetical protein
MAVDETFEQEQLTVVPTSVVVPELPDEELNLPQLVRKYMPTVADKEVPEAISILADTFKGRFKPQAIGEYLWRFRKDDRRVSDPHIKPMAEAVTEIAQWTVGLRREFDTFNRRYNRGQREQSNEPASASKKRHGVPPKDEDDADSFTRKNLDFVEDKSLTDAVHELYELSDGRWQFKTLETYLGRIRQEKRRESGALGELGKQVNKSREILRAVKNGFDTFEERYSILQARYEHLRVRNKELQARSKKRGEAIRSSVTLLRSVMPKGKLHRIQEDKPQNRVVPPKSTWKTKEKKAKK